MTETPQVGDVLGHVESVNVGTTVEVPWGSLKRSAIDKRPAQGSVDVDAEGVVPDQIADVKHHGGIYQAVYAFSREELDWWSAEAGADFGPGNFGENLTTVGFDLDARPMGERWRIGGVVLELSTVRIPCSVFAGFVDQPRWVKRFTERGRPGPYLRVIEPGQLSAGDAIELIETRDHDFTVSDLFRAATTERELLARVPEEPRIEPHWQERAREMMADR